MGPQVLWPLIPHSGSGWENISKEPRGLEKDTVRGHGKVLAEERAAAARETAGKGKLQKKVEKLQAAAAAAAVKECGTCE